jgi:hypothetical protein
MNTRGAWWIALTCGGLLSAALGCGSDNDDSSKAASDMTAASNMSSGSAVAGRSSMTRENVTKDECLTQTLGVFSLRPERYSMDCFTCLCEQNPRTVAQCDDQADICWGLIGCVAANCAEAEGIDEANCAVGMCGQFIEGSGLAMAIGALLRGDACAAKCPQMK